MTTLNDYLAEKRTAVRARHAQTAQGESQPARLAANLRGRLLRHLRSAWDRSLGPSVGTMK